ncbi:hypothetical protein B194_3629 [Serratia plymuthica A30]|jgi:hypothetical protein|nr:hypothetical protein B194_3629 [Serratia plymuthica A30]
MHNHLGIEKWPDRKTTEINAKSAPLSGNDAQGIYSLRLPRLQKSV